MEMLQLEILLGLLLLVLALLSIHRFSRGGGRDGGLPLIGHTVEVLANYHRIFDLLLEKFQSQGTSTVPLWIPGQSYVFTVDPANVEYILKTRFQNFPKGERFREKFQPLLGAGIFNADGAAWKSQRKTASFEFASRVLREWSGSVFRDHALELARIVRAAASNKTSLEMQDLFLRMTLDTICNLGFGVHLGLLSSTLPHNDFAAAFDRCNAIVSFRFADPFWKLKRLLRIGEEGDLPKNLATVDEFTYNIIRKRRIQLSKENEDLRARKKDLLSRFMLLDESSSDAYLRDIVLNFVIAGRDTTAATLSYFIYMVASHPDCQARLHSELLDFDHSSRQHEHHDDDPSSMESFAKLLTLEALAKLPYLHAAVNETLRLYPSVPLNFKGVASDDVLPDGTRVRRGEIVSYVPYCMGRMESLWGPDAADFRPERWRAVDGSDWDFNSSPFKFTAFQAGPRVCLGKDSAYLQIKITAALLCRFFEFRLVPNQNLHYRVMATISLASGIKVVPLRR
ncbi:cytochrome P450 704B1 [Selaginella moellendorffii]|uniref:cytochrome P450 704B1 n=1 Tax=Selaginella moellendorffii TaxID=88036 RepID=UPI000D1C4235|nr:cytochrome P450 704B1 [Selaginella moellendorffii]|eukprot:XP_024535245.1 cytochrome P450 704B1 [Selaginella moellendorffii]